MNTAVYNAARRKGCTQRQAELLAVYVESSKILTAADVLGITEQTAKNQLSKVYRKLGVPHAAAAVAKVLAA